MLKMLQRGGTGQAIMGLIVFTIILVFLLEFRSTSRMQTGSLRRECAARVSGECVTPKDFYAELGLVVPRGVAPKQVKALGLRKHVLDGVVERELLVAEAQRLGISVDEEAAKHELRQGRAHASLPAGQALRLGYMLDLVAADETGIERDLVRELPILDAKTQEVDDDLYGRVVRSMTNRSPKEFLKMQQREVLASRMRDLVRARVRVSEEEAWDAFEREKSKAVIRFVRVDADWFTRYARALTDPEVDRFLAEHQTQVDDAWKSESSKWKADCLVVSEITASFAEDAFEADKSLGKDKLDRAKSLVEKGRPFADVARELSDGPSALSGGKIGCLTADSYGEGGDVLSKAASALSPGGTSAILETKRGYHLVHLDGRLAASDVEAVGRRAVARPLALRQVGEARAKEFAERLIKAAQGGARLDDTVKAMLPEFVGSVAAWVSAKPRSSTPTSTTVSDESAALADPHAPKAEISAPFTVDGEPVPGAFGGPPIARTAFALAKAEDVHPEPIPIGSGVVVVQLKEKTAATREDFATEKGPTLRRLQIQKRADALTRYVARLRQAKEAKIEVNDRILEDPKAADRD
jgi:peptidyl-prolyl cis-trans isomerase D